jgi:hypothetical protein
MVFPKEHKQPAGRAVAVFGPRRWPNNVIPYDLSDITCK